jgi:uncharacterized protein involved in outer membrane biogenesis
LARARDLLAVALASLLALAILGLAVGRLIFDDERLRVIAERELRARLDTEVTIGRVELRLCSGVEVHAFHVGPPAGFREKVLAFDRLALHWSCLDLARLRVVIPEIALEGVEMTLEENDTAGRNIDALTRALAGNTPTPEPQSPPPPAEAGTPEPLSQPSLPVKVELNRLAMLSECA